jgi:predicted PurR-regulated permease PerM
MKLFTKKSGITINISSEAIVRAVVIIVLTLIGIQFLGQIAYQLQLIFTAAFLALALNPAVSWFASKLKNKSRTGATGLSFVIVILLLGTFFTFVVPPIATQMIGFVKEIPETVASVSDEDSPIGNFVRRYSLEDEVTSISDDLKAQAGKIPSTVVSTAGVVGGAIISTITVLVLSFMMLVEGPRWFDRLWAIQPKDKREHRRKLAHKMYQVVTGYVNGQVLIALLAALFAMAALLIGSSLTGSTINVVAMGGIVFLFGLIPLIGNTLAAVIVILVSLFTSLGLAIGMGVYFLLYQQIENVTLQPYIQAKSNQLTPLIVFIAALIGAGFGGILGAFVAIPVAGCIRVLMEEHFGEFNPDEAAEKLEEERRDKRKAKK